MKCIVSWKLVDVSEVLNASNIGMKCIASWKLVDVSEVLCHQLPEDSHLQLKYQNAPKDVTKCFYIGTW
jgi:hypothetical protein